MDKINYLFTKYDETSEEREKIYSSLLEAYQNLNDLDK